MCCSCVLHPARVGRYPGSQVTAVSNSRTQRDFIMGQAAQRGLKNVDVLTANMLEFTPPEAGSYDRVYSIEMFEHMKNYAKLLARVSSWMRPGAMLFVHIFVHRTLPYHFEVESEADWMSKYFFTGGTMPSLDLLLYFQEHLTIKGHWYVNGVHYSKTLEHWLKKQDAAGPEVTKVLGDTYGRDQALVWANRWRVFYIACSELFRYNNGNEWASESESYRGRTREWYACVERSKTEGIKQRAGRCHKRKIAALHPETPIPAPPCHQDVSTGRKAATALSCARGAWPADHSTQSHQVFSKQKTPAYPQTHQASWPRVFSRRFSLAASRMCMMWDSPAAAWERSSPVYFVFLPVSGNDLRSLLDVLSKGPRLRLRTSAPLMST
eukprot:200775-Chlamydomonas_euryale.AAC.5